MLYVTTRNNRDAFTVNRVLQENRCPDGGFYLPLRHPKFSQSEIDAFAEKTFNQRVADILNLLFNTRLTGWDIDFSSGREPVRLEPLGHRILIAEFWHNPGWSFDWLVKTITTQICDCVQLPSNWTETAVRVAILFGIFGELKQAGIEKADIAVVSGDFLQPVSAWYARQWGLPIGNIICCCNENNSIWDLFSHGQIRTDTISIPTVVSDADVAIPAGLERLLYECGDVSEVMRFVDACRTGSTYSPNDAVISRLRAGACVSVVSSHRTETTIPSVYRTHSYVMGPGTALAYSGLMDYRAKTGETRTALVIAERSPVRDAEIVANALGIPEETFRKVI